MKVYITHIKASEITSIIKGYLLINEEQIKFNGIAFGRIGGHNVNIKLSKKEERRLEELGYNPEEVIIKAQRMLIEGDIEIIE